MIKRLTIIGVGLIGGSLARILKQKGYCHEVVGCGRDVAHLKKAQELGVIDRFTQSVVEAVSGADMVVVAVPLGAMESCFSAMVGHLAADAVITDVGSAKGAVIAAARRAFGQLPAGFVPGHPIAGTEKSGVDASFAELYQGRRVILTPLAESAPEAVAKTRAMWEQAGAHVDEMAAAEHDETLAATSHLPQLLAYSLVNTLINRDESEAIFHSAGSGFRDTTRLAASDPVMWRDIALANKTAILAAIDDYSKTVAQLRETIQKGDGTMLERSFNRARDARIKFMNDIKN